MAERPKHLQVVGPDDVPVAPVKPKTIVEAAEANDALALLVALRTRLAKACQDESTLARDLAALSRRLIEVDRDIKAARKAAEQERREGGGTDVGDEAFDATAI